MGLFFNSQFFYLMYCHFPMSKIYIKVAGAQTPSSQGEIPGPQPLVTALDVTELFGYLQNDSSGNFQHSKQCKYKEKYLSTFSKVYKRKQTFLLAKVNSRCFFPFSSRHACVAQKDTNMVSPY